MTTDTNPAVLGELFDVREFTARADGSIERVPLEHLELAYNPRRTISPEGIDRLAAMMMRCGQLVPAIGRRIAAEKVLIYAGQRRLLAARRSQDLATEEGYEGLAPLGSLTVILLDHEPTDAEIRRIQAQENQREELTLADQQDQFADCWADRAGLCEDDRVAAVCQDLGINPAKAHNLRRQLTLPEGIRQRVAVRPTGAQLSVTLANKLADMHEISRPLTAAVAERVTTSDLHERALQDLGAFVHRTCLEDENLFAVRIDEGALLDAHEQLERARGHLTADAHEHLAGVLDCEPDKVDTELDVLSKRAKSAAVKLRVDGALRERAANGRFAFVAERGRDFADGIWVVDPLFMIEAIHHNVSDDAKAAREETYFGAANLKDDDIQQARQDDDEHRQAQRARQQAARNSNVGLGADIVAGLLDPSEDQLRALRNLVCHLVVRHYPEVIAYGAGWTDRERQQPVGDSGRYEPRQLQWILDAELQRALDDHDPLRGIAQLMARFSAAFVIDPDGVTKTKALGTERTARKLRDALPGGENPLRNAVWEFVRPMLSPRLVELNRDEFVTERREASTVDLQAHRQASDLSDVDLGEPTPEAA